MGLVRDQLAIPADIRIIMSSIQVIAEVTVGSVGGIFRMSVTDYLISSNSESRVIFC